MNSSVDKSLYEQTREDNIARNKAVLDILGFADSTQTTPSSLQVDRKKTKKIKRDFSIPQVQGTRVSKRLRAVKIEDKNSVKTELCGSDRTSLYQNGDDYSMPSPQIRHWALDVSGISPNSDIIWNISNMHQHLELSESRRIVVTTGCAGYGGVMTASVDIKSRKKTDTVGNNGHVAEVKSSSKAIKETTWTLKVLCEGVGGFSCGVSLVNAGRPFKSLGNRPDCWVLHSSGQLMHNRHRKDLSISYEADDIIQVKVTSAGKLKFILSRSSTEVDAGVTLPNGKYVLCCQPYMGGAAALV